jgi:hypothetical protein
MLQSEFFLPMEMRHISFSEGAISFQKIPILHWVCLYARQSPQARALMKLGLRSTITWLQAIISGNALTLGASPPYI